MGRKIAHIRRRMNCSGIHLNGIDIWYIGYTLKNHPIPITDRYLTFKIMPSLTKLNSVISMLWLEENRWHIFVPTFLFVLESTLACRTNSLCFFHGVKIETVCIHNLALLCTPFSPHFFFCTFFFMFIVSTNRAMVWWLCILHIKIYLDIIFHKCISTCFEGAVQWTYSFHFHIFISFRSSLKINWVLSFFFHLCLVFSVVSLHVSVYSILLCI